MNVSPDILAALPWGMTAWDILLSLGMFVAAVGLVVAVFSQSGEIHMSAQREAAIATGHTDRRTVFEQPLLRPVMWLLLATSHRSAVPGLKRWLTRTLVAAGSPKYYTCEEYLALAVGLGVLLGSLLQLVNLMLYGQISFVLFAFGLAAGAGLAIYSLYDMASRRVRLISPRVPYALDLIALAMGAGATFTEAVRTVVGERSDDPLNVELRAMLAEMDLGAARAAPLQNLADRVPLESLRTIVASVTQAEELGTPLSDVLHDQATLLRLRRSFAAENKAAVASVRILVPCLLLVIAVILAVFGPAIVRIAGEGCSDGPAAG